MAGGASGYGSDDDSGRMIVDINVTPLVDITLVLLIIFMVTASLHRQPGDQGRPAEGGVGHRAAPRRTLALTLTKDGALYLNGERSSDEAVVRFIGGELPRNPELQAIIAADRAVPHGDVMHVIDLVKRAGVRRFALNVDPGAPPAPLTPERPPKTPRSSISDLDFERRSAICCCPGPPLNDTPD